MGISRKIEKETEIPPKVLQMFDAVNEMLSENVDINHMKVADITNRAGIGKGTAYEYFSSKEELITKALLYDTKMQFIYVTEAIQNSKTFQEKVMAGLDWIAENFKDCKTFTQLVRIGMGTYDVSSALQEEFRKNYSCREFDMGEKMIDEIMECGVAEGIILPKDRNLRKMAFSSQILMFAMYLSDKSHWEDTELTVGDVKQFAYESIVKALN